MPTSHPDQLNEIVRLIMLADPKMLLDVGVGFGKYGLLAREYLELWDGRERYRQWSRRIDGIEAFGGYLTPVHDFVYNRVYVGDALEVLPALDHHYDLALLIDVLEHFDYEDGRRLLSECRRRARNLLVSTPKRVGAQREAFGNPYETHRFEWQRRHLTSFGDAFFVPNAHSINVFLGEDAPRVRKAYRKLRRRNLARAHAPALVAALRRLRTRARASEGSAHGRRETQ